MLAVGERLTYGISEIQAYTPVLVAADAFPFYAHVSMRSLARRLGVEVRRNAEVELGAGEGALAYPLEPLRVERPARPLNVVWLVMGFSA